MIEEQDFRFSSFPRMRESSHSLKRMDTRLRGYDEFTGLAKVLKKYPDDLAQGVAPSALGNGFEIQQWWR
jgi:hypothetical protein